MPKQKQEKTKTKSEHRFSECNKTAYTIHFAFAGLTPTAYSLLLLFWLKYNNNKNTIVYAAQNTPSEL